MRIEHCGAERRTVKYFLWLDNPSDYWDYEVVLKTECPRCKRTVMERCMFNRDNGLSAPKRIKYSNNDAWELQINSRLAHMIQPGHKPDKDTTVIIFVGEYTQDAARGQDVMRKEGRRSA